MRAPALLLLLLASAACNAAPLAERESTATGDPVETRPREASNLQPAFAGQTRAPRAPHRHDWTVTRIAGGFDLPWGVDVLDDGRFLVTEKAGTLWLVSADGRSRTRVGGVRGVISRLFGRAYHAIANGVCGVRGRAAVRGRRPCP